MTNKIEVLKQQKDGLDVLPDLLRYAREGCGAIEPDDFERLKWYGLFHRRATPGYFMLRLRVPNGVLTSEQLAAIGEIANRCGRGQADITTRQNIQLRWIEIEDVPWIFQRLSAAGLTSQQSGMDNVRNVVGCPVAGLDPDELIDSRRLAVRLQQAIIGHKRFSNPAPASSTSRSRAAGTTAFMPERTISPSSPLWAATCRYPASTSSLVGRWVAANPRTPGPWMCLSRAGMWFHWRPQSSRSFATTARASPAGPHA